MAVAFSPDYQLLASASIDNTVKVWSSINGALKQTLSVQGMINDIEFSNRGTVLETDFRQLGIQFSPNNPSLTIPELLIEDNWISLHGRKVLWLPPVCRPSCSAVRERTVALGHTSGNISLIEFCT
jgi:WD40 repeat protein